MREQPSASELLDGVAEFMRKELMPRLSGRVAFHARIAVNVLAIVRREMTLGPAAAAREAARLAGVRTTRVSITSYVVCSVIAAVAGLLELSQTGVGAPDLGATLLLTTVTAVVIGGVSLFGGQGSVIGVLGGALVLAFLLINPIFYSFYANTSQHPRFLYASLPELFVLWAAGIGVIAHVLVTRPRVTRSLTS